MLGIPNMEEQWENFVKKNQIPKNIRREILDSWIRCKNYKVDPYEGSGKEIEKEEFDQILQNKKELIEIAKPIMLSLYNVVKESNYSIILTDENAVILEVIGNKTIMERNTHLYFLKGCQWTEENVGTNAIGTCIYLDQPIQTLGAEHYGKKQHGWTCSAAPIHDNNGKIIGAIDLSGDFHGYHSHTLGIVVEAANSIQEQFLIAEHRKWVKVAFESIEDGILIIDSNFIVKDFNLKMCEILKVKKEEIYTLDIKVLLNDIIKDICNFNKSNIIWYREVSLYVDHHRVECNINVTPVQKGEKYIGFVIVAKKVDSFRHAVNKIAGFSSRYTFEDIITDNFKMKNIVEEAKNIAENECSVLITGESGTGKELFAHAIHNESKRQNGPFVAINCAALPKDLVESELFGYEKGSFTGALKEGQPGKFELANKGTIFLDEIGELPLEMQSKLLRILDNHTVTRIGGTYERNLDVRVIAATNRNLYQEIQTNNFRSDLYYRLNVFNLKLLPLRERREDIVLCTEFFLDKLNQKNPRCPKKIDENFIQSIINYHWPGNVRELENMVQRAYYLSKNSIISSTLIPDYISKNIKENANYNSDILPVCHSKSNILEEIEKKLIIDSLKKCNGNVVDASKMIGIGKSTLYRKIKKYEL
ncbi:sigma-54-dependent Fis family transcriptional regulator [Inediibacterium massiliense]|uniref:sigma-54-dependent Fis family transcriptional regulator n=1 Tax=Inediibacterium massiliense TaxID=1658111 RepID=UPI000AC342D7|nr:sigma-54-dependent Fis family transcriptional regulator [Inediibacterium massiliense]